MTDQAPQSAATDDKPPEQRPERPEFWCKRFGEGVTPWDAGRVPAAFARFAAGCATPPATLIPGCGSAWEAAHLAARGWPVTALDFSPGAVAAARQVLGDAPVHLLCEDFFGHRPAAPYGLIYERAFMCALPPALRSAWSRQVAALLAPGGLLAGYFFVCDQAKGPPFGILPAQLDELLGAEFERLEDVAVEDSIQVFAGRERWQVWRRR